MEKRIKNQSGDLLIRKSLFCGIVEIVHLWDKPNNSGCLLGYWEKRICDGDEVAEFRSVNSRIVNTEYDSADILLQALMWGQQLADLIICSSPPST